MNDKDYVLSKWTNGTWSIEWMNEDEIIIKGPYEQKSIVCGGDFEGILSCLCDAFRSGKIRGEK